MWCVMDMSEYNTLVLCTQSAGSKPTKQIICFALCVSKVFRIAIDRHGSMSFHKAPEHWRHVTDTVNVPVVSRPFALSFTLSLSSISVILSPPLFFFLLYLLTFCYKLLAASKCPLIKKIKFLRLELD